MLASTNFIPFKFLSLLILYDLLSYVYMIFCSIHDFYGIIFVFKTECKLKCKDFMMDFKPFS